MQLTFLGAAGTVTGSQFLLQTMQASILIDCGMFQGVKVHRKRNWQDFSFDLASIDAVLLTHAHLDHSGLIPRLYNRGYQGPIYSTEGTLALCSILLPDSGYLQEEDARYFMKKGFSKHSPPLPLYTELDAKNSLNLFKTKEEAKQFMIKDCKIRFSKMGHILGASSVEVESAGKKILFSGDVGRPKDLLMDPPTKPSDADYIVMESTYGGYHHPQVDPIEELGRVISPVLENDGIVLIPSFAVGRAQSLIYAIDQLKRKKSIPDVPVYLNSPMATNVSELFCSRTQDHKLSFEQAVAMFSKIHFVHTPEDSTKLNSKKGPMIIISASGMLSGGRVLHHLKQFGTDENNMIVLVGYQAPGTRGEKLLRGSKTIKIHGEYRRINAKVVMLDIFSAHADHGELLKWLDSAPKKPKKVFLVHGENIPADELRSSIQEELKLEVEVASFQQTVEL